MRSGRISVVLCTRPPLCILRSLPKSLTARSVELAAHFAHPDLAAMRRRYILKSLADAGVISKAAEGQAEADNTEITVVPKPTACR